LFFASAAFVHPSISTLTAHGPVPQQRPLLGRLIVTTAALTIPVLVLALTDPADNSDRAVRAMSIFVLTAAVTARVIHAVRANAQTQRELIFSAETDALTGLPNRPLMLTHVSNALIGAWSESRQPTVLFIDVDRFKNINDSLEQATILARVARRLHAKVNLIPYNTVEGLEWKRPNDKQCRAFRDILKNAGVQATLRLEKGHDIEAACGQLRLKTEQDRAKLAATATAFAS
jgi:hypothetical protein